MTKWFDLFLRGEYQATIFVESREKLADFSRRYGETMLEETGERAPYPEEIRYMQRSCFNGDHIATLDSTGSYISTDPPARPGFPGQGDTSATDSEGGEI